MTGIKDVADEVGLSMATVSRALRGRRGVSAANRRRIEEAAARLGYVASSSASALATGRTRTVAVLLPFVTRWYFATVVHGAEQVLRDRGYDLLLYNLGDVDASRDRVFRTQGLHKRTDAVIVIGLQPTPSEQALLSRHDSKVVVVGGRVEAWPSTTIDDVAAAMTGVQHLIDLGHERIAFVGGNHLPEQPFYTPEARRDGYRTAMAKAGIEVRPAYDLPGGFTLASGLAAGRRLLALPEPPTAVFCASDEMAIGLLRAARERGVAVPDELSVVGVDDHELAEYVDLTTVRQPVQALGRLAARQVLQLLGEPDSEPALDPHVELATELVVRGTTAPPG